MVSQAVTLPPVSAGFQQAVRELGRQIGWRNVGKLIAFGPVRGQHKVPTPEETAEREYAAQERNEAMLYLSHDNPVLDYCNYRQVSRWRVPTGNVNGRRERARARMIEQVTVLPRLAEQLRARGVKIEHSKRTDTYWADVEDEAWGADCWMTECFQERYGQPGYSFDDALPLLRKAAKVRALLGGR